MKKKTKELVLLCDASEDVGFPMAILKDSHNIVVSLYKYPQTGKWRADKFYGVHSWDMLLKSCRDIVVRKKLGRKKLSLMDFIEKVRKEINSCDKFIENIVLKLNDKYKH